MDAASAIITIAAGFGGVVLGGFLARRNERLSRRDQLLVEGLNDTISAIAEVAGGNQSAQYRYSSAAPRIALHASPAVVAALRSFQEIASTATPEGRRRFILVLQETRRELGHKEVPDGDIEMLLFGGVGPRDAAPVVPDL